MRRILAFAVLIFTTFQGGATAEPGLPRAKPEEVGLSSQRLERITTHFQRYVDEGKLAGVTFAIARRGKLAYLKTMGWADIEAKRLVTPDTIFQIQSMTKPITAVAAMTLVEEGRLRLSDPVSNYLPEFADVKVYAGEGPSGMILEDPVRSMTIHDLLTHTSGLTYGIYDQSPVGDLYREADELDPRRTLEELSHLGASLPLSRQPGSTYQYGISFDVLARVIEVVTDRRFGEFLSERIFNPLEMVDTHFIVPREKKARFSEVYMISDSGALAPSDGKHVRDRFQEGAKLELGGGGLVSTVGDYLRFSQLLLNRGALDGVRIISPKTVALMTSNQLPDEKLAFIHRYTPGWGVGFGVGILNDLGKAGHLGSLGGYRWDGGANTYFFVDPHEDLIVVLLTQFRPFGVYPLREEMMNLTYQAIVD